MIALLEKQEIILKHYRDGKSQRAIHRETGICCKTIKNADNAPFASLIAGCVIETQKDYCRLLELPVRDNALPDQATPKAKKSKDQER